MFSTREQLGASLTLDFWSELKRFFLLLFTFFSILSLFSYSPLDPSWATWTTLTEPKNWMGRLGSSFADILVQSLGLGSLLLPAFLIRAFRCWGAGYPNSFRVSSFMLFVATSSLCEMIAEEKVSFLWNLKSPGGLIGASVANVFAFCLGSGGAKLFLMGALVSCLAVLLQISPLKVAYSATLWILQQLKSGWKRAHKKEIEPLFIESFTPVLSAEPAVEDTKIKDPEIRQLEPKESIRRRARAPSMPFELPPLNHLSGKAESKAKTVEKSWYLEKSEILTQKLRDFGVEGEVVHISPGPVITVYEFKPASGVKIKEIANLSDDLTLALSVLSVRIVAPIPGKPVVGIEIPSPFRETVFFKDLVQETAFDKNENGIPIVLGRLASGEGVVAGLAGMPHLLVAGSTGTGKSVFINTLICSLLYRFTPQQMKLILVDPKMVELSSYEGIPHLLLPVVVDSKKAVKALRWAVDEMDRRYSLMHQFGVRHVDGYNERITELSAQGSLPEGHEYLPYICIVIDEYADLMAVVPKDVELSITRLAQKARASGIHLVLATQRPSTDVVTGIIKANFPSRISFRVASSVDSKTILDRTGAERLLGSGDMLFHSAGFLSLKRMQGAYISDSDIEKVVAFLKEQGEPVYDDRILLYDADDHSENESNASEENSLYGAAMQLVTEKGEASISLIQRHLKIGYNRAATLMEELEKKGVVGGDSGTSKRRTVLLPKSH